MGPAPVVIWVVDPLSFERLMSCRGLFAASERPKTIISSQQDSLE